MPYFHKEILALKGSKYHYNYIPSNYLSGDYFNFVKISDKKLGIFVGDVMGHGVQASLVMMLLKSVFESSVYNIERPKDLMNEINQKLLKLLENILIFATAAYAVVDLEKKVLCYSTSWSPSNIENK